MSKGHSVLQLKYFKDSNLSQKGIEYAKYRSICIEFNKLISNYILNGFEFKLPLRLGILYIKQVQTKIKLNEEGEIDKSSLKADHYKTKLLRLKKFPNMGYKDICKKLQDENKSNDYKVYHYNTHTKGKFARWSWMRDNGCRNVTAYIFKPTKWNRLELGKRILKNPDDINKYKLKHSK